VRALILVATAIVAFAIAPAALGTRVPGSGQAVPPASCVTIGRPKPSLVYTYRQAESTGTSTRHADRWESATSAGSRVHVTRQGGTEINVTEHHVVDDVMVLDRSSKLNASGGLVGATAFHPGIVGDPAFRACAGRSWRIASVTATYQSGQSRVSATTPAGMLRIVAIHEKISVPAGQFDTVRYIRTSQSIDEYWKSIEHGVVVKHIATLPGAAVVTEVLTSID
jgi:hypothetical protein